MNKVPHAPSSSGEHADEHLEMESHFILRLPENTARDVREWLNNGGAAFKDKIQINFNHEMRKAQVKVDKEIFDATLMDLPCIIETLKTVDKKNFYKVADVAQILICKPEGKETPNPNKEPPKVSNKPEENNAASSKKKDKQFQYPHGITAPLKNVRKRRFRKTLKKKYMDAPELEKELKRLLRADLEAEKVRYEVVTLEQEQQQKLEKKNAGVVESEATKPEDENLGEDEIFGGALSSSSDDDDEEAAEGREMAHQLMADEPRSSSRSRSPEDFSERDPEFLKRKIKELQSTLGELENDRKSNEIEMEPMDDGSAKDLLAQQIVDSLENEKLIKDEISELKQILKRKS